MSSNSSAVYLLGGQFLTLICRKNCYFWLKKSENKWKRDRGGPLKKNTFDLWDAALRSHEVCVYHCGIRTVLHHTTTLSGHEGHSLYPSPIYLIRGQFTYLFTMTTVIGRETVWIRTWNWDDECNDERLPSDARDNKSGKFEFCRFTFETF